MNENELNLESVSGMLHAASLAKSRISELEATAKSDHERVDYMLAEATEVDRKTIADIMAQVEQFWRRRLAENPSGKKSIKLAWGNISAREQPPEFVKDEAVLEEFAEQHGFIRETVKREVDWAAMKADGYVIEGQFFVNSAGNKPVPGIEVIERDPKVSISID